MSDKVATDAPVSGDDAAIVEATEGNAAEPVILDFPVDFAAAEPCWSPNFDERHDGLEPYMLLLHYTGMGTGKGAQDWLCDPESEVSAHYIVFEDGRVVQLVTEDMRAWHAGRGSWHGQTEINSRSIGIEIVNGGHHGGLPDYPGVQVEAVIALAKDIVRRHAISPVNVIGHSDMAPARKNDPGERFPWHRLAQAGIVKHVEPAPITGGRFFALGDTGEPVEALQAMLALYGFEQPVTGAYDETMRTHVEAFQRRHRPARVDGVADVSTIKTLLDYLKAVATA